MNPKQSVKYTALLSKVEKAESEMRRAFRRWEKYRGQLQRLEKRLDKELLRVTDLGGRADWRDFNDSLED